MRAGPLSDVKVIDLLNHYFVPVYLSNEDFERAGSASSEERKERERIFRQGYAKKLSVGTVHVYILDASGLLRSTLHVAEAAKPGVLVKHLEDTIRSMHVNEGPPVVHPRAQSLPPASKSQDLVLHLVSRTSNGKGAWSGVPGENWIVLEPAEQEKLWPRDAQGAWTVEPAVARKILECFYPTTENNDLSGNRIELQELKAQMDQASGSVSRAALSGRLKMQHTFYHHADTNLVEAEVVGYMEKEGGRLTRVNILAERARYNGGEFEVAVQANSPGKTSRAGVR